MLWGGSLLDQSQSSAGRPIRKAGLCLLTLSSPLTCCDLRAQGGDGLTPSTACTSRKGTHLPQLPPSLPGLLPDLSRPHGSSTGLTCSPAWAALRRISPRLGKGLRVSAAVVAWRGRGRLSHTVCLGVPGRTSGKEPACQCRRHKRYGFDPWVGKIPWRRVWQPTPVFLPGESHEHKRLVGYSP